MDVTDSEPLSGESNSSGGWYPWYVASILAIAAALSYMDRQVINLLVEPLKADLRLTDFQISLLQGLAFVLFYATMAMPLGYLADRWRRRNLIAIGVFLWSLATAACGLAASFWQLFAGRLTVGVGEASLMPAAHSLLPDYFGPTKLSRAFSILQMGIYIGNGLAYAGSGLVIGIVSGRAPVTLPFTGVLAPWQVAFLVAASPGPLIALLMLTVREPMRRKNLLLRTSGVEEPGVARFMADRVPFFVGFLGAAAFLSIVASGILAWTPSLFIRRFGWSAAKIGVVYGNILVVTGICGTLLAGYIAELWTRRNKCGAPVRLFLCFLALLVPCAVAYPLSSDAYLALTLLAGFSFSLGGVGALTPTILVLAVPHTYRGRTSALYMFVQTALGVACGPLAVAALTDFVFHDTHRLNQSIAIVAAIGGLNAFALTFITYRQFLRLTLPAASPAVAHDNLLPHPLDPHQHKQ